MKFRCDDLEKYIDSVLDNSASADVRGAAKIKNAVFAAKSYEETEKILSDFIEEN